MRLGVWRTMMAHALRSDEVRRMQAALEAKATNAGKGSGMRQLTQVMGRLMKGEVRIWVGMWRTATRHAVRAAEEVRVYGELKQKAKAASTGLSARQLRKILTMLGASPGQLQLGPEVPTMRPPMEDPLEVFATETPRLRIPIEDPLGVFVPTQDLADESLAMMTRLEHLAMLVHLHVVVNKIICMHERGSVGIWRMGMELEQQQRMVATQAVIIADTRAVMQSRGLHHVVRVLGLQIGMELCTRVHIWRMLMKDAIRIVELARERDALQRWAASQSNAAGVRQLRQIMVRVMRGDVAMVVEVWRAATKVAAHERHGEMHVALEAQMHAHGQAAGVRQLRQIVVRMTRGELGLRVQVWRAVMADALRSNMVRQMQAVLEAKAGNAGKGAGMRQLKQIVVRMAKGAAGLRVEVWRTGARAAAYKRHCEVKAALEAQMHAHGQAAGVRMQILEAQIRAQHQAMCLHQLRRSVVGLVQGEAGFRVAIWRSSTRDDVRSRDRMQIREEHEQSAGLRYIRSVVSRLMRDAIWSRVVAWRAGTWNAVQASKLARELEQNAFVMSTGLGMAQLRQIMSRAMRRNVAMLVEMWGISTKMAAHARHQEMQAALKARIAQGQGRATALISMMWARRLTKEIVLALQNMRRGLAEQNRRVRGERVMKRVGVRMINAEAVYVLQTMKANLADSSRCARGARLLKRVGARMKKMELVLALQSFQEHFAEASKSVRGRRLMMRACARMSNRKLVFALQSMRFNLTNANHDMRQNSMQQANVERLLTRVGVRMTTNELVGTLQSFQQHFAEANDRGRGRRLLKRVQARMTSKELASALQTLRANLANEKQAHAIAIQTAESTRARKELERKAMDASTGMAVRLLRQIMVRVMRGDVVMLVKVWRTSVDMAACTEHRAMQAALEAQMHAHGQAASVRQVRQIIARMVRGEVGMRVQMWHTMMLDALRLEAVSRVQATTETNMLVDASRVLEMARMQAALEASIIADAGRVLEMARMQSALEAQMHAHGQEAGARQLRQIVVRMMEGKITMLVGVWRAATRHAVQAAEEVRVYGELEQKAKDASTGLSARQLRQILTMLGASPGPHPGAAKGTTSLAVSIDDPFGAFEQTEDPADESLAMMTRLQHLAMLVHLHVVVNKIICMHERSSIGIWRMGMELEQQQRMVATQAVIIADTRAVMQSRGLHHVVRVLGLQIGMELCTRVHIWRMLMKDAMRIVELARERDTLSGGQQVRATRQG